MDDLIDQLAEGITDYIAGKRVYEESGEESYKVMQEQARADIARALSGLIYQRLLEAVGCDGKLS